VDTENDEPPYVHNRASERSNAYMVVGDSKLVPLLVALSSVGLVLAGLATGVAFWALSYADKARMEARILQVKVEGFENALHAQGIDPAPHLRGQSK
jgi:hypothetical protein